MKRPLSVRQCENGDGEFWYVIKGRNGKVLATSEMYPSRRNAIRAARAFVADIDPVQVEFSYCVGPIPPNRGKGYGIAEELVR